MSNLGVMHRPGVREIDLNVHPSKPFYRELPSSIKLFHFIYLFTPLHIYN